MPAGLLKRLRNVEREASFRSCVLGVVEKSEKVELGDAPSLRVGVAMTGAILD